MDLQGPKSDVEVQITSHPQRSQVARLRMFPKGKCADPGPHLRLRGPMVIPPCGPYLRQIVVAIHLGPCDAVRMLVHVAGVGQPQINKV